TLPVARNANINVDGKSVNKLAALPAGVVVHVGMNVDQKTIRALSAQGPGFQGVPVKAVDAVQHTITFADQPAPGAAELAGKTLSVHPNANINIDGKAGGRLAAVPGGVFVDLALSVDRRTVLSLSALGSQLGSTNHVVVVAIDADKNTISVDIPEEGEK